MKLLILLGAILIPVLGSAVAFLLYVPVITILGAVAIAVALLAAFALGFTAGRGRFETARANGRAKVIHINSDSSGAGVSFRSSM